MEISLHGFLDAVDECNRAGEMALGHAESILSDAKNLSPRGRKLMIDVLIGLITVDKADFITFYQQDCHN